MTYLSSPGGSDAVSKLVRLLLRDGPTRSGAELRALSAAFADAGVCVAGEVVAIRCSFALPRWTARLCSNLIVDRVTWPNRVIAPAHHADGVADALATRASAEAPMAVSIPMAVTSAATADRHARRALVLTDQGLIAPAPVIWCGDHAATLWLHSEPRIVELVAAGELAPLANQTPTVRLALAETMLAWATTRASAGEIADRLGIHAQTVRYRWRRLHEVLGVERMQDPHFIALAMLALRVLVPQWRREFAEARRLR